MYRVPKMQIKNVELTKASLHHYVNRIELSFELNDSPDLFIQLSQVLMNVCEISKKFSPDRLAPHQSDMLHKIHSDLERYLIKNGG